MKMKVDRLAVVGAATKTGASAFIVDGALGHGKKGVQSFSSTAGKR